MSLRLSRVEFYKRGGGMIDACRASIVPRQGEYINISRTQWKVAYVSWSLDDDPKELRANVELESVPEDEVGPIDFENRGT